MKELLAVTWAGRADGCFSQLSSLIHTEDYFGLREDSRVSFFRIFHPLRPPLPPTLGDFSQGGRPTSRALAASAVGIPAAESSRGEREERSAVCAESRRGEQDRDQQCVPGTWQMLSPA